MALEKAWADWTKHVPLADALGLELLEVRAGYAKGVLPANKITGNHLGGVHGGALFTLADTIAGVACLAHGHFVTTVDADIHYLTAAPGDSSVHCEATQIRQGRTIGVYHVELSDGKGALFAAATFTFYILDAEIPELKA